MANSIVNRRQWLIDNFELLPEDIQEAVVTIMKAIIARQTAP